MEHRGRKPTRFELILFLHEKFLPDKLIGMGYKKSTVYKYLKYYQVANEIFQSKKGR